MPTTYNTTLTAFTHFLTAYIHSILYLRALYPPASFLRTRFHNTPVHQSRHPAVCTWIVDAVAAIKSELEKGSVSRIAIVLFHPGPFPLPSSSYYPASSASPAASSPSFPLSYQEDDGPRGFSNGEAKILERYVLDVSAFPVLTRPERFMDIEWVKSEAELAAERQAQAEADARLAAQLAAEEEARYHGRKLPKKKPGPEPLDANVSPDLSEQMRAAFITLGTRVSQLKDLPEGCSFNVTMELKDKEDASMPELQKWMPSQPSLQMTGREGSRLYDGGRSKREGGDLGGAKVTPVRAVEAGVFRFEAWIEEGKEKFETEWQGESTAESYEW